MLISLELCDMAPELSDLVRHCEVVLDNFVVLDSVIFASERDGIVIREQRFKQGRLMSNGHGLVTAVLRGHVKIRLAPNAPDAVTDMYHQIRERERTSRLSKEKEIEALEKELNRAYSRAE